MNFEFLHPADELVMIMNRIYYGGMTTTSGGNLSILDENGDIWITPSGVDKGTLTRGDICRVKPDGKVIGSHKPSVELPFHASIYRRRPDLRAVLHAHPPHLVAFSVARKLPDVNLLLNTHRVCGDIAMAPYAVPGSKALGEYIAAEFEKGFNAVVLENHGVCVGADNIFEAFKRFETLEFCAMLEINARKLGKPGTIGESEIRLADAQERFDMDDFAPGGHSPEERAARCEMISMITRSYQQRLFGSTHGACSVRLSDGSFLITPHGVDRALMNESSLVLIKDGMKEQGKTPSRSVKLHRLIYEKNENIQAVTGASPPHAAAFAVTDEPFDPRTIPESYIQLRHVQKIPFSQMYGNPDAAAAMFSDKTPVLICGNNQLFVTGASLQQAFERLEVAEATARSVLAAGELGGLVHISDAEVEDINKAFNLS